MAKLWGGRFQKSTDKKVDDFNSSIRFDKRMYAQDIKGSIAHAKMLGKQGIIDMEDLEIEDVEWLNLPDEYKAEAIKRAYT